MKTLLSILISLLFLIVPGYRDLDNKDPEERIEDVIDILQDMNEAGDKGIPASMLRNAEGVVFIPKIVKAGFIIGGKHGKGIAMVKNMDGSWSNPLFLKMTGGSIGWQVGVQKIQLILLFRDRETVASIGNGEFEIGADASATAGPVGRRAAASTNAKLEAEIYSYSRSKGLFVGISLNGSTLEMDEKRNEEFYDRKQIKARHIFNNEIQAHENLIAELKQHLNELSSE